MINDDFSRKLVYDLIIFPNLLDHTQKEFFFMYQDGLAPS